MKQRGKLLFLAVFCALLIPLMLAGNAGATTFGDGSKPNPVTGAWEITDYGQCIAGVQADGTMVVDTAHNLSRPDCIDHTYTSTSAGNYDTSANCVKTSGRTGDAAADVLSHYFASTCVAADNTGINLDGLDRTATNCLLKGGTWKSACVGAWVYTGSHTSNNPVLGDGAPGFCYTTVRLTSAIDNLNCPTGVAPGISPGQFGYALSGANCNYTFGIAGYANANIVKKNGSGNYAAAGVFVDLSALTQGQCIAAGASWNTGASKSGTSSVATTPNASTIATGVPGTRAGCLECHNSVSQNNGYAERWKEPYLMHGHKNMLRKVTAGQTWAGPDGVAYTAATGGQTLNFAAGTATLGANTYPLMYLFGDWMAPAPAGLDTVVWKGTTAAQNGGTSAYSCASCHATGWSNPSAGVCVVGGVARPTSASNADAITTSGACATAGGTWFASNGIEGASYNPSNPGASWAGNSLGITVNPDNSIPGITGRWDIDGITCSRCHYAGQAQVLPAQAIPFAGPGHTISMEGHRYTPATTANHLATNICFGCHQGIAKSNNGLDNTSVLDPVVIPVKNIATAPAYVPEFNGHVIGNSFLNSPHARFTGTISPNPFGKFDLVLDNVGTTAVGFDSHFAGDVCRSSGTFGGGSILAEVWDNNQNTRITTKALCLKANNAALDCTVNFWQKENQGSCTSCHQVHESLFDPNAKEPLKVECTTCHDDKLVTDMRHSTYSNTPAGLAGGSPARPCEICHMPKATSGGFPMHLWRINSSASYNTFPTAAEFGIGATATNKNANTSPDGAYASAVWVDLDRACGQCHGGGTDEAHPAYDNASLFAPAPYFDKATLALFAANKMHLGTANNLPPVAKSVAAPAVSGLTVSFTDNSTDDAAFLANAISVNWGDGSALQTGNNLAYFTHNYATAGSYSIILKATDAAGLTNSVIYNVTGVGTAGSITGVVYDPNNLPLSGAIVTLKLNGGTKASKTTLADGAYAFPNLLAGTYTVQVYKSGMVFDGDGVSGAPYTNPVTVPVASSAIANDFKQVAFRITVNTGVSPGVGAGAMVYLKQNGVFKASGATDATGAKIFAGVAPGTYQVQIVKSGVVFGPSATQDATVGPGNATVVFTHTP